MNKENISSLMAMVEGMGFGAGPMRSLLQHACLHAKSFTVKHTIPKGKDILNCSLYFEERSGIYSCPYYDASLLKDISFPEKVVNGVNIADLDKRMASIDWASIGSNTGTDVVKLDDPATWQAEATIGKVVDEVVTLSLSEEAKLLAEGLKLKYWGPVQSALLPIGNLAAAKSRFETTQRFYVVDNQCIPLDEAWRFLNNKWLERKVQESRKKQTGNTVRPSSSAKKPIKKAGHSNK